MPGREMDQKKRFGTTPMDQVFPVDPTLRKIWADVDDAFSHLASAFDSIYGTVGNVPLSPAVLRRAWLLKALDSVHRERAVGEQIQMNAGFRWFVGLDRDDKVFDASTLSFNRKRLWRSGAAEALETSKDECGTRNPLDGHAEGTY